jgi:hypothetical protein
MSTSQIVFSAFFVVIFLVWVGCAVATIIPNSNASKDCHLGYRSYCSFTPFSTIISVLAAFVAFFVGRGLGFLNFF